MPLGRVHMFRNYIHPAPQASLSAMSFIAMGRGQLSCYCLEGGGIMCREAELRPPLS